MIYADFAKLIYCLSYLHIILRAYFIFVISNKNFIIKTECFFVM